MACESIGKTNFRNVVQIAFPHFSTYFPNCERRMKNENAGRDLERARLRGKTR